MLARLKAAFTAWPYCLATYVALIGAAWLLFVPFQPVRLDPTVYPAGNPQLAAETAAKALDGRIWVVSHTGSMKPLLQGGEYAVTVKEYANVKLGQVLVYNATYHNTPIIHRAVDKDSHGWLMAGDTAARSESWARVTDQNYLGTVVAVYRKF
jgi:hypothetical protein